MIPFLGALMATVLLDLAWFNGMAWFYKARLEASLRLKDGNLSPVLWSGALVYLLLVVGIAVLVLPRCEPGSIRDPLLFGGLYGLVVYGVYGTTNHAILRLWPVEVLVVDSLWGVTSCALVTLLMSRLHTQFA